VQEITIAPPTLVLSTSTYLKQISALCRLCH